ncbi:MAG: hypothetical protein DI534_06875 [Leifsonia xyli]|nr:MAG: hypothetical protein DI534_06875 [Leifsonia xyli]
MATPPDAAPAGSGGGWIFPLRDAAITTRAALVTGAVALSLTLLSVLAVLGIILIVAEPDSLVWWAPIPLLPLAGCCLAAWRWEPLPPVGYALVVVGIAVSLAALTAAAAQSPAQAIAGTASFLLSMSTNVAVLIGASADRWTGGVAGAIGGYLLGEGTIAVAAAVVGLPYRFDVPPIAIAVGVAAAYAIFPFARRRARRGTASLEAAGERSRARRVRDEEARESIALLHDTILGELAVLANSPPGALGDRDRERVARSLELSAMLPLLREETAPAGDGVAPRLVAIAAAGGVRLRLEGAVGALDEVPDTAGLALRAALEQCVVNIARHAGVDEAWLSVDVAGDELGVTIVDKGVGFDPAAVPRDRLGLSESVRGRIIRGGGSVRVWSSPGAGTSVQLTVPRGEPS